MCCKTEGALKSMYKKLSFSIDNAGPNDHTRWQYFITDIA